MIILRSRAEEWDNTPIRDARNRRSSPFMIECTSPSSAQIARSPLSLSLQRRPRSDEMGEHRKGERLLQSSLSFLSITSIVRPTSLIQRQIAVHQNLLESWGLVTRSVAGVARSLFCPRKSQLDDRDVGELGSTVIFRCGRCGRRRTRSRLWSCRAGPGGRQLEGIKRSARGYR